MLWKFRINQESHIHMYGDTGDLLHLREAARELGSLAIE